MRIFASHQPCYVEWTSSSCVLYRLLIPYVKYHFNIKDSGSYFNPAWAHFEEFYISNLYMCVRFLCYGLQTKMSLNLQY